MSANNLVRRTGPAILLILLVGSVVYSNTFNAPFALDDEWAIVGNPYIKDPAFLFSPSLWSLEYTGRIVALWSFAFNYALGGLNVFGYHLVNLLVHLTTGLLVFTLLRLTFRTPFFSLSHQALANDHNFAAGRLTYRTSGLASQDFVPLFASLLFVCHPVQTQAVTYIVQRMTSLTSMFYLLAVVLYVMARLHLSRSEGSDAIRENQQCEKIDRYNPLMSKVWPSVALLGGGLVATLLAMKTKEIAFTLPLVILLYEIFFFHGTWKRRLIYLLPFLATLPIVPMTVFFADIADASSFDKAFATMSEKINAEEILPRWDYLCTQFRVIVTYLRLLLLPINQNLDYDYPVYTNFFTPQVFLSFLLLAGLFVLAIYLLVRSGAQSGTPRPEQVRGSMQEQSLFSPQAPDPEIRLIAFGLLWFFLTLAVESSIMPIPDVIVEHRLYLPGVGAATAFAAIYSLLTRKFFHGSNEKLVFLVALLLVAALGVATYQRNHVWGDAVRLWQDVVLKSPNKARPYNNLGVALNKSSRWPQAIEAFTKAIALKPTHPDAYSNLGRAYVSTGQSLAAVPVLKKAIGINPQFENAYINLAAALNQLRRFHETVTLLERNAFLLKDRVDAHYHLGVAYAFLGNTVAARRQLEIVSQSDSANLVADLQRLLR